MLVRQVEGHGLEECQGACQVSVFGSMCKGTLERLRWDGENGRWLNSLEYSRGLSWYVATVTVPTPLLPQLCSVAPSGLARSYTIDDSGTPSKTLASKNEDISSSRVQLQSMSALLGSPPLDCNLSVSVHCQSHFSSAVCKASLRVLSVRLLAVGQESSVAKEKLFSALISVGGQSKEAPARSYVTPVPDKLGWRAAQARGVLNIDNPAYEENADDFAISLLKLREEAEVSPCNGWGADCFLIIESVPESVVRAIEEQATETLSYDRAGTVVRGEVMRVLEVLQGVLVPTILVLVGNWTRLTVS